jgi:hypothetical protein
MRSQAIRSFLLFTCLVPVVHSFTSYANDFVDPDYILAKNFNSSTKAAQNTVVQWADELASQGPWSECILVRRADGI